MSVNRRTFLTAAGLTAGSLMLPSFAGNRARAGDTAPPKRFVVFYTGHGTVYEDWKMRRPGLADNADWEFDLAQDPAEYSPILEPLAPFARKLCIVDGLALVTAFDDTLHNEHETGSSHSLTATPFELVGGFAKAGGPSIDQVIARDIRRMDRFPSIELGVWTGNAAIYSGPSAPLPVEMDPYESFRRLFPPDVMMSEEPTAEDLVLARRRSVLDFVRGEYERVAPRLSREDRRKLEVHRDFIRDLEVRIEGIAAVRCERPNEPLESTRELYPDTADAQIRTLVASLACDLTRVASIQMGQLPNEVFGAPPGDVHNDFAHNAHENPDARRYMTMFHRYNSDKFRLLLELLDSVPEGDGTLLDNTVVLWCGELATGDHKFNGWPAVIAGGGGPHLKLGRYIRYAPVTPNPFEHLDWNGVEPMVGVPHNKLFTSLSRAVGSPRDEFGQTTSVTQLDETIDLRGPLPRLGV